MNYEPCETVVETLGPKEDRRRHMTTIDSVLDCGSVVTETGRVYDDCGIVFPREDDPAKYRSIRRPLIKDSGLGQDEGAGH